MMYHLSATLATTKRVLRQLKADPRTIGLIFVVPCILLALLRWMYNDNIAMFNAFGPALLAIFPLIIMFLVTSIATLRERVSGTLERVLITPISKMDFLFGYAIAFGLLAILQSVIASFVALKLLGLDMAGPEWFIVLIALANALLGMALGLLVSAFARSEFQAVQFLPAIIFPQLLLCGLFLPLDKMPGSLEFIAHCLPMTYAVDAMQRVIHEPTIGTNAWYDVLIVAGCVVVAIVIGALTLRRRSV